MDPQLRVYFLRIVNTLSLVLLWFIVNATAGIKYELAYIEDALTIPNILFYCWLVSSLILLLWRLYKIWIKPLDIDF
jgi:hypothetical protein